MTASKTPLLDKINDPGDLRALPKEQLTQLARELRQETIDVVSVTGGHLGAGLGVELTAWTPCPLLRLGGLRPGPVRPVGRNRQRPE